MTDQAAASGQALLPGVSVVIPTHNRPGLLAEALDSVLAQTLPAAEIIVVDDASDPPARPPAGPATRLIRHDRPLGGAAAKSAGAAAARGELLAFLDDDDLWAPTYLETAANLLAAQPEVDVLFMGVDWFGARAEGGRQGYRRAMDRVLAEAGGRPLAPGVLGFGPALVDALVDRVPMAFQRPVVRRAAFQRIGGYLPHCLLWDCDWALRAALDGRVALSEAPLYRQRVDYQGYSSRPEREREQTRSNIEIRERLAAALPAGHPARAVLLRSAGRHWFHLAYQEAGAGQTRAALAAWWASQRRAPTPAGVKLLARILLGTGKG